MNPDDKALAIAARIADGSAIDWEAAGSDASDPDDRAVVDELKAIAGLATLHRAPSSWTSDATDSAGTPWGPLTITSKIDEGRFGQVYLAWDARLHRRVALKLLLAAAPASALSAHAIEEARLLARVRHPNVLAVYGAERIEERIGIWTEFIEGHTLEALVTERGPMPSADVVTVGLDLCRALAAVHAAGLLHRDIKAQNVMREIGGRIVLMDFGTVHDLEARPASAGDLSGTPLYLAPEILGGAPATPATDVYALAVLLFRMLTGKYPVPGKTLDEVRAAHQRGNAARLRDARPDVMPALAAAIDRGLAPDPSKRYESAAAFEAALAKAQQPRAGLGRWPVLAAAVAGVIAIGGLAWSWRTPVPAEPMAVAVPAGAGPVEPPAAPPVASPALPAVPPSADTVAVAIAAPATHRPLAPPRALLNWSSQPSRDGRYWPFVDVDSPVSDLRIWLPATGERRQVTRIPVVPGAPPPRMSAAESAMSSDGKRVVYAWSEAGVTELRVAEADGSGIRKILPLEAADRPEPIEWSRNGEYVLAWLMQKGGRADLALVPSKGGAPRILQSFETRRPRTARLSPDARFVVYDFRPDPASGHDDVFIVGIDRSPARLFISGGTDDYGPVWTPDGRRVFFLSNRSGTTEGWTVEVDEGSVVGEPVRVAPNLGAVTPIAITDDGAYYYDRPTSSVDVYTLGLDLTGSERPGAPVRAQPAVMGGRVGPSWSPDGTSLAYIKASPRAQTISIQDVTTGKVRDLTLHPPLSEIRLATAWSLDGATVLVRAADVQNRWGYFAVDVVTGAVTPAKLFEAAVNDQAYGSFGWSSDSQSILFRHSPRGIVERHLSSGAETVLVDGKANSLGNFNFFAQSPDGRSLAFTAGRGRGPVIFVVPGEAPPRELVASGSGHQVMFQAWTPDSKQILFTKFRPDKNPVEYPHELWIIPVSGGEARDTRVRISGFANKYRVALSPDGQRLAFTLGEQLAELWVMEGFLPKPKRR